MKEKTQTAEERILELHPTKYPIVGYETTWYRNVKKRKGKHKGKTIKQRSSYRTKSLTGMHHAIHNDKKCKNPTTTRLEDVPKWPFGLFAMCLNPELLPSY